MFKKPIRHVAGILSAVLGVFGLTGCDKHFSEPECIYGPPPAAETPQTQGDTKAHPNASHDADPGLEPLPIVGDVEPADIYGPPSAFGLGAPDDDPDANDDADDADDDDDALLPQLDGNEAQPVEVIYGPPAMLEQEEEDRGITREPNAPQDAKRSDAKADDSAQKPLTPEARKQIIDKKGYQRAALKHCEDEDDAEAFEACAKAYHEADEEYRLSRIGAPKYGVRAY